MLGLIVSEPNSGSGALPAVWDHARATDGKVQSPVGKRWISQTKPERVSQMNSPATGEKKALRKSLLLRTVKRNTGQSSLRKADSSGRTTWLMGRGRGRRKQRASQRIPVATAVITLTCIHTHPMPAQV